MSPPTPAAAAAAEARALASANAAPPRRGRPRARPKSTTKAKPTASTPRRVAARPRAARRRAPSNAENPDTESIPSVAGAVATAPATPAAEQPAPAAFFTPAIPQPIMASPPAGQPATDPAEPAGTRLLSRARDGVTTGIASARTRAAAALGAGGSSLAELSSRARRRVPALAALAVVLLALAGTVLGSPAPSTPTIDATDRNKRPQTHRATPAARPRRPQPRGADIPRRAVEAPVVHSRRPVRARPPAPVGSPEPQAPATPATRAPRSATPAPAVRRAPVEPNDWSTELAP